MQVMQSHGLLGLGHNYSIAFICRDTSYDTSAAPDTLFFDSHRKNLIVRCVRVSTKHINSCFSQSLYEQMVFGFYGVFDRIQLGLLSTGGGIAMDWQINRADGSSEREHWCRLNTRGIDRCNGGVRWAAIKVTLWWTHLKMEERLKEGREEEKEAVVRDNT